MKKLLILWMVLVAFASCTDRKDLFDSGRVKEEAKENFPIKDIDPDQDWNMMAVRTLDITINAGTGAVYTVKVLTDNPFKVENDAHVLAVADVKDGTTATLKFDAPSAMEYAYVMRQVGTKDCTWSSTSRTCRTSSSRFRTASCGCSSAATASAPAPPWSRSRWTCSAKG